MSNASLVSERIDQGDNVLPRCHWCQEVIPHANGNNLVHVGGEPNDVYACDRYLKGEDCRK